MRTKIQAAVTGAATAFVLVLAAGGAAHAHGYPTAPTSRQSLCAQQAVSDCGASVREPQSVEGPKKFPAGGPADGEICSGGNTRFAKLDDPRGGTWPTTALTAGASHTFRWTFTVPHRTTDFQYFITRDGWNPAR